VSLALFSLAGKVVIVTGSGRGLGRAIAKGMAAAGAAVVTCSRTLAESQSAADEIGVAGGEAIGVEFDAARPADCERLVEAAVQHFGRLDVMHCNASIDLPQPAEQVDPDSLRQVLAVNVGGYLFCAQAAARQMMRQGKGGSIVMTSSNASLVGFPGLLSYCISKGGVDQMVRTLALEWGQQGIRVNAFNPGYMEHAMTGTEDYEQSPEIEAKAVAHTPMRRRGRVEEVVGPAIFLASDASSFMTGTVLPVDGGWCAA
jgi:NAD(P)-dependent dehydrogenase (short-subunit alcohol dehydrogenase family)